MENLLLIIGTLLGIIAILKWSSRSSNTTTAQEKHSIPKQSPPPLPSISSTNFLPSQQSLEQVNNKRINPLPIMPISKDKNSSSRIYDYPKCPIDRRSNVVGKPQQIYWSTQRKCYYCSKGHYFTGKEH